MKYQKQEITLTLEQRKQLNEKVLCLIDSGTKAADFTGEDIYNAYTGDGGLHGLAYLRRALRQQNKKPSQDVVALVKQNDQFVYKAYSTKAARQIPEHLREPVPIYQAVLDNIPEQFPGFERFLRRKRREYDIQSQPFRDMEEDPDIAT